MNGMKIAGANSDERFIGERAHSTHRQREKTGRRTEILSLVLYFASHVHRPSGRRWVAGKSRSPGRRLLPRVVTFLPGDFHV